jgi:DNA-binding NarL/FixJ family response regulator
MTITDPVSILLADERTPARAGLRRALEHHGFEVVAEAANVPEALSLAIEHEPQVCLLEVDLPGDAILAVEDLRYELPLTKAGADGYLLKTTAPDRLSAALRALVRGEIVLPRALTAALVVELRKQDPESEGGGRRRRRRGPRFLERRLGR